MKIILSKKLPYIKKISKVKKKKNDETMISVSVYSGICIQYQQQKWSYRFCAKIDEKTRKRNKKNID